MFLKWILASIFLLLAVTTIPVLGQNANIDVFLSDGDDISNKVMDSIFKIIAYDGFGRPVSTGSGFFINEHGSAITCFHVIDKAYFVTAIMPNNKLYVVDNICEYNKKFDLALINVSISEPISHFLSINTSKPRIGQTIIAAGAPRGISNTVTSGKVSNIVTDSSEDIESIMVDVSVAPGSSGGPVTNTEGEVIGVVNSGFLDSPGVNFAIPSWKINKLTSKLDNPLFALINEGPLYLNQDLYNTSSKEAEFHCQEGDLFYVVGSYAEAAKSYDMAISDDPSFVMAWNNKGSALLKLNMIDPSIECFDKAIDLDPMDANAWLNKGTALGSKSSFNDGITCLNNAIRFAPLRHGLLQNSRQDWDALMAWFIEAEIFRIIGRNNDALNCYDQAIKLNPNLDVLWNSKGVALINVSRNTAAIECFNNAIYLNTSNSASWNNKGVALFNLKDYYEAIKCYRQSTSLNPRYIDAWQNLALAYFEIGETVEGNAAQIEADRLKRPTPTFRVLRQVART
jgi:tetratricopeptide (TPR) repeat protein